MEILYWFISVLLVQIADSHWWLSSQVFTVGYMGGCSNIAGLVRDQKALCRSYPTLMEVVGNGAQIGLQECQHQFATSKWNCSHVDQKQKGLLGLLTSKGNKEAAFFQAITSAGVVTAITRACNQDKHASACRCVNTRAQDSTHKAQGFEWSGCNDNVKFGMKFSKRFLDAREVGNDARGLMNKHNNLAGRTAVERHMRLECTCHGVSGACNVKTCRHSLPEFYVVGDSLQQSYHRAALVSLDQMKNILEPKNPTNMQTSSDLVFLEQSPDYCVKDLKAGTLGVEGRQCNKTSMGPDGCDVMCCGMGFRTKKVYVETNCNCEFIWCCKVQCQKCGQYVKQYFCRGKKKRRKNKRWQMFDQPRKSGKRKNLYYNDVGRNQVMRDQPYEPIRTNKNNS